MEIKEPSITSKHFSCHQGRYPTANEVVIKPYRKTHSGQDDFAKVATIRTTNGLIKIAFPKIYPLRLQ